MQTYLLRSIPSLLHRFDSSWKNKLAPRLRKSRLFHCNWCFLYTGARLYHHNINGIFKPSYKSYYTISQMGLGIPLRKTNTGQQALSFLGPKMWIKISHCTKNVKTAVFFIQNIKRGILSNLLCK